MATTTPLGSKSVEFMCGNRLSIRKADGSVRAREHIADYRYDYNTGRDNEVFVRREVGRLTPIAARNIAAGMRSVLNGERRVFHMNKRREPDGWGGTYTVSDFTFRKISGGYGITLRESNQGELTPDMAQRLVKIVESVA